MSEIGLYAALTKLGLEPDEAEKAVADVASAKEVATKADIVGVKTDVNGVKADVNAVKWMVGLLLAINIAFIASAIALTANFFN
ncbi:MAG: hypothetical protein GDA45_01560 [Chromatiales bacterium]|nr:hypothetical protein [Chromatiales bacterium]